MVHYNMKKESIWQQWNKGEEKWIDTIISYYAICENGKTSLEGELKMSPISPIEIIKVTWQRAIANKSTKETKME
jgi:hypothetical protein